LKEKVRVWKWTGNPRKMVEQACSSKYKVIDMCIFSLQRSADLEWLTPTEVVWDSVTVVQLGLEPTTEKDVSVLCVELGDSPLELRTCRRDGHISEWYSVLSKRRTHGSA
jgi:hypothetical protein